MAFEEPGGRALFCGTAEPATSRESFKRQVFNPHAPHTNEALVPQSSSSPAHGVIVIGVTEAGGFQLAAHHRAGALIPRQVALKSTLTVQAGTCDTPDKCKGAHVGSGPGFLLLG